MCIRDSDGLLGALSLIVGGPCVIGQLLGVAQLLPQFLGHVGGKRVQQFQQNLVLGLGGAALVTEGVDVDHQLGDGGVGLQGVDVLADLLDGAVGHSLQLGADAVAVRQLLAHGPDLDVYKRQVHSYPFASTMCIGNMRSGMESLVVYFHLHDKKVLHKALHYFGVILLLSLIHIWPVSAAAWLLLPLPPLLSLPTARTKRPSVRA